MTTPARKVTKTTPEQKQNFLTASSSGNSETIDNMLDSAFDNGEIQTLLTCQDEKGRTPLTLAITNNHTKTARNLIQRMAACNSIKSTADRSDNKSNLLDLRDSNGQTALMLAVIHKNPNLVQYLINFKANLTIRDNSDNTAEKLARQMGQIDIADLIKNAEKSRAEETATTKMLASLGNRPKGSFYKQSSGSSELAIRVVFPQSTPPNSVDFGALEEEAKEGAKNEL